MSQFALESSGPVAVDQLPDLWRALAERVRRYGPEAANALEDCAAQLDAALHAASAELLTIEEAATESGYSLDHLRHMVAGGAIPNAGRKGKPRVRRGDLPKKATRGRGGLSLYDPDADALELQRASDLDARTF